MGKLDTVTKAYMKNNSVFADAFNYLLYGGRQVLDPSRLQELDTVELSIPFGNGEEAAVQRFRDLLKTAAFMTDDEAAYLVLGVENEADIKYAEPVKAGLYDFLQYARQVQQTDTGYHSGDPVRIKALGRTEDTARDDDHPGSGHTLKVS